MRADGDSSSSYVVRSVERGERNPERVASIELRNPRVISDDKRLDLGRRVQHERHEGAAGRADAAPARNASDELHDAITVEVGNGREAGPKLVVLVRQRVGELAHVLDCPVSGHERYQDGPGVRQQQRVVGPVPWHADCNVEYSIAVEVADRGERRSQSRVCAHSDTRNVEGRYVARAARRHAADNRRQDESPSPHLPNNAPPASSPCFPIQFRTSR